jgi:hypothetical protein
MATLVLMIFAFVLLVLAALNVPVARPSLGWAGMACWCLALIVGRF